MMKDCRTLDDAIVPYYHNLETLTPRNLSAFWAAVPRLLRYQERGVTLVPQLEAIFLKTADQIHSYGPIYLTTTTLGFAKTIQTLQRSKRGYGKGSYEGYLHGILIRQRDAVFSFLARTVDGSTQTPSVRATVFERFSIYICDTGFCAKT